VAAHEWDFAVAWEWEYDADFVMLLRTAARDAGLSFLDVTSGNVTGVLAELQEGLAIRVLLDRASDSEERFLPLQWLVRQAGGRALNHDALATWASDKTTMHLEFLSHRVNVPFTVLLPPLARDPAVPAEAMASVGSPFFVKPARFGGGVGVASGTTLQDIKQAREKYPDEKFLLQELLVPASLGARRAWFRPMYCCGDIHVMWWDDRTHIYEVCTARDEERFGLFPMRALVKSIAEVSAMDLFTTEVCLLPSGRFVSVDYVNTPCDMRLQSRHAGGVPDSVVRLVVQRLVAQAASPDVSG